MSLDFTRSEVSRYWASRFPQLKQVGTGEWRGPCPIHHGTRDSFAVNSENGLWTCHSECHIGGSMVDFEEKLTDAGRKAAFRAVMETVGRAFTERDFHREQNVEYVYRDIHGEAKYRVVRTPTKEFFHEAPDGQGGWAHGKGAMKGVDKLPYRVNEWKDEPLVVIVEGEKDVDALWRIGIPATTNSGGAGNFHESLARYFRGKSVAIIPDNDDAGHAHAEKVSKTLSGVAAVVKILSLGMTREKADVSDWLRDGGAKEDLLKKITSAIEVDQRREQDRWLTTLKQTIERAGGINQFWDLTHKGIPTPFPTLTRAMRGGFQYGEFYVFAAHSGIGKTSLALQFGHFAAEQGYVGLNFSMEMMDDAVFQRMVASKAQVDLLEYEFLQNRRFLSREQLERRKHIDRVISQETGLLAELPFFVYSKPGITVEEAAAVIRRVKREHGRLDFVIFDHIQLMSGEGDGLYQSTSSISRGTKKLCKEESVAGVVLSQCNRKSDKDEELDLEDLRDSGAIGEDAAGVGVIWHEKADKERAKTEPSPYVEGRMRVETGPLKAILKLPKMRYGVDGVYIELEHEKRYTRFRESNAMADPEPASEPVPEPMSLYSEDPDGY